MPTKITFDAALVRLKAGNARFVAGSHERVLSADEIERRRLAAGQSPIACVLACSDSRVPIEVVFDQAPGELFVIRVAGNVAAETQIGSAEFSVGQLGTPLLVVLGHSGCGAVSAAISVARGGPKPEGALGALVDRLLPATNGLVDPADEPDAATMREAVEANVRLAAGELQDDSNVIRDAVGEGRLRVVGAVYDLESGRVTWL